MDVAGNNAGTDSPGDSMGDDEPQVGYRREWVPPAEDVLPCKALLLSCGGRSYITLMIIGFNMRELYLYRRVRKFEGSRITRKSVSRMFRDELLTEKVKQILYQKGG